MEGSLALLIPILALSIPLMAIWSKHQQRLAEMRLQSTATDTAERAAQYASQVAALEERVRVLERIVTDSGYNVSAQIEALRDTRHVEDDHGVPLALDKAPSKERA
ncbi:hypothetical protein [Altererythrobacter lauratis]|uniref:Phage shock protein B n=1 Tax=Alteraurantiacibacter lauratis TaxID=2054627 RepID=A0ABV7EEX3_9SPHN